MFLVRIARWIVTSGKGGGQDKTNMDDNLFSDAENNDTNTPQTYTIGDREYTQDQLNDLVTKGNQYNDIETRFNTKLDRVVPDYTRASQEAAELRAKVAEFEKNQYEAKAKEGQLTREEIVARAKIEAAGIGLMTDENTPQLIRNEIEGYELRKDVDNLVDDLSEMGISADPQIILKFMDAADIDSPQEASEKLYGPMIKAWQDSELAKQKPDGLYTEGGSNAGSFRVPDGVKINDDNLLDMFREAIGGEK